MLMSLSILVFISVDRSSALAGLSVFKWTPNIVRGERIAILFRISINQCMNACWNSELCGQIRYTRLTHRCVLRTVGPWKRVERTGDVIFSLKSEWEEDRAGLCKDCKTNTQKIYGCMTSPMISGVIRQGNTMNVGSKVKYTKVCPFQDDQVAVIKCNENGKWDSTPVFTDCECSRGIQTPENTVYTGPVPDIGWLVVFRAVAGGGGDIYYGWLSGYMTTDDVTCGHLDNACCASHYRSNLDFSPDAGITKVRFSFYKDGVEVAYVVFDGTDISRTNWFDPDKILESTWPNLRLGSFTVFSMYGNPQSRRFLITTNYDGCSSDRVYMMAVLAGDWGCRFDKHTSYPQFLYSTLESDALLYSEDIGLADLLVIAVSGSHDATNGGNGNIIDGPTWSQPG